MSYGRRRGIEVLGAREDEELFAIPGRSVGTVKGAITGVEFKGTDWGGRAKFLIRRRNALMAKELEELKEQLTRVENLAKANQDKLAEDVSGILEQVAALKVDLDRHERRIKNLYAKLDGVDIGDADDLDEPE
jgi:hypothetical protein